MPLIEVAEPVNVDAGIHYEKSTIIDRWKEQNIPYRIESNLAGQHLLITDPAGNEI